MRIPLVSTIKEIRSAGVPFLHQPTTLTAVDRFAFQGTYSSKLLRFVGKVSPAQQQEFRNAIDYVCSKNPPKLMKLLEDDGFEFLCVADGKLLKDSDWVKPDLLKHVNPKAWAQYDHYCERTGLSSTDPYDKFLHFSKRRGEVNGSYYFFFGNNVVYDVRNLNNATINSRDILSHELNHKISNMHGGIGDIPFSESPEFTKIYEKERKRTKKIK